MEPRKLSATVDIKLRIKEPLRADIEAAATRKGISMNAEMVDRLERSFERGGLLIDALDLAYGSRVAALAMMLARAMYDTGAHGGWVAKGTPEGAREWIADPYAFDQVAKATATVIEGFRPDGEIFTPKIGDPASDNNRARLGQLIATGILEAVRNPTRGGGIGEWAKPIRKLLGKEIERIRVDDSVVMVSAAAPTGAQPSALATLTKAKSGHKR